MKIVSIRIELKQGLPNYSSRSAEVMAVADENESLDIQKTVADLSAQVKEVWTPKALEVKATPELEKALAAAPMVTPVVAQSAPITEKVKELKEEPKKRAPKKTVVAEPTAVQVMTEEQFKDPINFAKRREALKKEAMDNLIADREAAEREFAATMLLSEKTPRNSTNPLDED